MIIIGLTVLFTNTSLKRVNNLFVLLHFTLAVSNDIVYAKRILPVFTIRLSSLDISQKKMCPGANSVWHRLWGKSIGDSLCFAKRWSSGHSLLWRCQPSLAVKRLSRIHSLRIFLQWLTVWCSVWHLVLYLVLLPFSLFLSISLSLTGNSETWGTKWGCCNVAVRQPIWSSGSCFDG